MNKQTAASQSHPEDGPKDERYQTEILQKVSRTFALTIPKLPDDLAKAVGNAYLLCRIADTIEDDRAMPAERKHFHARRFVEVVQGQLDAEGFAADLAPKLAEQTPEAEKDLITHTPAVIRVTHSLPRPQQQAMERCVRIMTEGMVRYQEQETLDGVADIQDMGRYCYHVAGVVGEMLTDLFCSHSPEIEARRAELLPLARSFGQGLQMTNILKDIWEDHARGACWLPRNVFADHGFDITRKTMPQTSDPGYVRGIRELIGHAHGHLVNALRYTQTLPRHERGLRIFCLWALGMAVMTLDSIHARPDFTQGNQVKICRRSVKIAYLCSRLFVGFDAILRLLFRLAAWRLPAPRHLSGEEAQEQEAAVPQGSDTP